MYNSNQVVFLPPPTNSLVHETNGESVHACVRMCAIMATKPEPGHSTGLQYLRRLQLKAKDWQGMVTMYTTSVQEVVQKFKKMYCPLLKVRILCNIIACIKYSQFHKID